MEKSKKVIIGVLVIVLVAAIAAGVYFVVKGNDKKKDESEAKPTATPVATPTAEVKKTLSDEENVKAAVLESYKTKYADEIDTVEFQKVKIYTKDEIKNDELLKDYKLGEKDIVFEVEYSIKVTDKCKDINQFTAGTGEVDGKVVKNKYNVGVLKYSESTGYELTNFGTGF